MQRSAWELVTEDDLDHFEIVRFLAHSGDDVVNGNDDLYMYASSMLTAHAEGHNRTKFGDKQVPQELGQIVTYTMMGRAKIIAKKIRMFDDDMAANGPLFPLLIRCVVMALAQKQRINMERDERTAREIGVFLA